MESKKDIRNRILEERRHLSKDEWERKSLLIQKQLLSHPLYKNVKEVYCYMDVRGEVGTSAFIQKALEDGKKVAIPKVEGEEMEFYYIHSLSDVTKGAYGILEPDTKEKVSMEPALLLMPGAAFDPSGGRIGYGGGYYDRYCCRHPKHMKMALAFDFQVVPKLPLDEFDIKAQWVLTERKIYHAEVTE